MKRLKEYIRKLDSFGVSYNFKYKSKEKYTTSFGGIVTLIFIGLALFIGIYNFIPFYNKKNFTTLYYVLKLAETEQIDFSKSRVSFSIGLNCRTGSDGTKAEDLFNIKFKYNYWDIQDGEYVRKIDFIETHPCTYADFYNDFNKTFDDSKIYKYQCLDDLSRSIEGIYASPVFSYYEFNVDAKNNSRQLLDKIESYLIENDCKLQIYYIDNTVDIEDYKNPIKSYLEADFIQINPTLSIRRNMYFMNQHLYDDDTYISLLTSPSVEETKLSSIYSRYEEYSLYQGLNRTNSSSDYLNWAKLFFRADTKRNDVKRKYQNIMEFYADASSLLIAFYEILLIIFNYINTFYAELSLSKKIFFFKESKNEKIKISRKYSKKISDILLLSNNSTNSRNFQPNNNNNQNKRYITTSNNSSEIDNNIDKNSRKIIPKKSKPYIEIQSVNNFDIRSESIDQSIAVLKKQKIRNNKVAHKKYIDNVHKPNEKREISNIKIDEEALKRNYEDIQYNFNLFELFFVSFCKCCITKNLGMKNNLNEKANNILNSSVDIVSFVRNQILINIINETILDNDTKSIINFLCRPIISINNNNKSEFSEFYQSYKESDFDKFSQEIIQLIEKPKKKMREKKLILLSKRHLKEFLIFDT